MNDSSQTPPRHSILVTDSGLGGMSVFNELAKRFSVSSPWREVELVYFNAWPAPHKGYNHYKTPEKRVGVFNNAMNAMAVFSPDSILIACNTLSVIYPETAFSRTTDIRVEGIVDHGVKMLHHGLSSDPESKAVVLGTPTTIATRSHEKGLLDLGVAQERILNIACTNLAGFIEREPFGTAVAELIDTYAKETSERLGNFKGSIFAGLCCTHFGYRQDLFQAAFDKHYPGRVTFLNPNIRMAEQAGTTKEPEEQPGAKLTLKIESQAVWNRAQIEGCLDLLPGCPDTVKTALRDYKQDSHLFSVD